MLTSPHAYNLVIDSKEQATKQKLLTKLGRRVLILLPRKGKAKVSLQRRGRKRMEDKRGEYNRLKGVGIRREINGKCSMMMMVMREREKHGLRHEKRALKGLLLFLKTKKKGVHAK